MLEEISSSDCSLAASTRTKTAGLPSTVERMSSSTKPSRIVATSPSVRMVPSSLVMSGMFLNSSPICRFPTAWRTTPPARVRNSPNVALREARRTILATLARVRLWRRSSSSFISMAISRSRVPRNLTWETDGNASRSSRRLSAALRNAFSGTVEDATANVITSIACFFSSTLGRSAFAGGKFSMLSTALRTSARTSPASAKVSSSTSSRAKPCEAVPTTRATPGRPTTLSSIRRLTSSSTSFGDAPGTFTVTLTVRRSISGMC